MSRWKVKCLICPNEIWMDLPVFDLGSLYMATAAKHDWCMSSSKDGLFICCTDCYPEAFDKSKGGSVGFLKDEYKHLCKDIGARELEMMLFQALELVQGLSEQQAMHDDWYEETLNKIIERLGVTPG